jgi:endo-1,4-beta-D-glucanase Y
MQYRPGFSRINVALCAALTGAAVAFASVPAAAQSVPFPSRKAVRGLTTNVLTTHELRAQYNLWKTRFVERCAQGDARIRYPESGNDTRSEGVGYGMVIAAYFGDQPTFDGLWDYYQRASANGLMNWRRDGCNAGGGGGDTGSASDADIDAAFGLIVANKQWGGYAADASALVGRIRGALFQNGCAGILLAGSQFAACGCINPSYIPPGYYPAFGAADAGQAAFWTTARNNSYTYFAAVNDNNTGLVPAWSQSNGSLNLACNGTPQVSGGGNTNEFQADAARTPWRVAMDYQWTGEPRAQTFLKSIADFAARQRIVQIVTRYSLAGNALEGGGDATGFRSTYTIGGFASAMTASTQESLDAFTGAWQSMYLAGDSVGANNAVATHAFNSSLALLYGLTITGLAWDPSGANATPVTEPPLNAQAGNALKNGDFDEGFLNWSMANLNDGIPAGSRAEGYAMHKSGELELRIQRTSAALNSFEVRLSQPVAVQTGRKYLISLRARASAARPIRVGVDLPIAPYSTFGVLGNRQDAKADAPVMLTTDMQTYEWVFTSTGTSQAANFDIDVGNSAVGLTIDDVFFGETDRPNSVPGEASGQTPTTTPDPNAPPGATPPAGGGTTPVVGGPGQVIPNQGDVGSTPSSTPASGGNTAPISGGSPPLPTGTVMGNGTCKTNADCVGTANALCSTKLLLCYDPATGYVANPRVPGGWSQPPQFFDQDGDGVLDDDCGVGNVWWEVQQGCYDPISGYAFDPNGKKWVWIGENFKKGQLGDGSADDSGCSVTSAGPAGNESGRWPWALGLALGAVVTLGYRRRSR